MQLPSVRHDVWDRPGFLSLAKSCARFPSAHRVEGCPEASPVIHAIPIEQVRVLGATQDEGCCSSSARIFEVRRSFPGLQ